MLGIGHRLEKQTKMRIIAEKAKEYNQKYDSLISQGVPPEQATKILAEEEKKNRQQPVDHQPYKNSQTINNLGGSVGLGFVDSHKINSTTKAMMQSVDEGFKATKSGLQTDNFKLTKTAQEKEQMRKIKERIKKDHLQQDKQVDLEEEKVSDYKKNFLHDEKMKEMCEKKDMKYNQRKNDLKWYAETYIKTKESLRK